MSNVRAVVTGAANGLGRAFAEELAKDGARLLLSDIEMDTLETTRRHIASLGAEVHTTRCDVRNMDDLTRLAAEADDKLGGTDLVINNAGVAVGGPVDEVSLEDWKWVLDINLWGVIHGVRAFVPDMKARGAGAVINVASVAGLVHAPQLGPYNVSKAGVVALSETLYGELHGTGVRVTVLCPSFFKTRIIETARGPLGSRDRGIASVMMDRSKVQANDVARYALDASARGQLHALPMSDARMMWRAKRTAPNWFVRSTARVVRSKWLGKLTRAGG